MRADQQVYIVERPVEKDAYEIVYIDPSWKNLLATLARLAGDAKAVVIDDPKGALTFMRVGQTVEIKVHDIVYRARSWYMQSDKFALADKTFEKPVEEKAPTQKAS